LHGAAWNGFSRTVNILLCNEADVNTINKVVVETYSVSQMAEGTAVGCWLLIIIADKF